MVQTVQIVKILVFASGSGQFSPKSIGILTRHFYSLSINWIMVDSPASERSGTPVIVNPWSVTRARSITQQSADAASIQTEPDSDNRPLTFELPRVTIDTKNGREE